MKAASRRPGDRKSVSKKASSPPPSEQTPVDLTLVGKQQLEALIHLGRLALEHTELESLFIEVSRQLAEGIGADVAEVWLVRSDGAQLERRCSWGWPEDAARANAVSAEPESQVAFTFHRGTPVVVEDLARETRFGEVPRLGELGIVSSASVMISVQGEAHGVLCVYSRTRKGFGETDVQLLQAAGTVLGVGAQWHRRQEELRDNQRQLLAGIVRDIVERREVETALRRTEERYRALQLQHTELERVAVAGELAGIVAHEIRTPLNALSINVQMLERALRRGRDEDLKRANGIVGTLRGEIERINNLLSDYLQVLRRPSRRADEIFSLGRVVQDAIRFVEPKAMTGAVTFELSLSPAVQTLRGDEDRLRQVLLNLLLNAIQAMPDGGVVNVSTALDGDMVSLEISDSGPGIPAEDIERIFQPFVTSKEEGTGLGLAISERLVNAMGGSIRAVSSVGAGACFEIRLPVAPQEDEGPDEGAEP